MFPFGSDRRVVPASVDGVQRRLGIRENPDAMHGSSRSREDRVNAQTPEALGERLSLARERAGMTIFELSVATGISESLLRRYLKGRIEPGATKLAVMAEVMDVDADWLLRLADSPEPQRPWHEGDPDRRSNKERTAA
jgi:ribosome-binding protein aMBF1 (putative translation factor)